jgi:hypothetical protein
VLLHILVEQLPGGLIRLGRSATVLSRRKGFAPLGDPHVTLHGGEAYTAQEGGPGSGHTFFDGPDDSDSQTYRKGFMPA